MAEEAHRPMGTPKVNAAGNVTVWDHGPGEPPDETVDKAAYEAHVADAKAWHKRHGFKFGEPHGPVPLIMAASDANHALGVEPSRYALEPMDLDDAEVEAEVQAIQDRRAAAAKASEERAAAAQLAADREAAVMIVAGRRREKPAPVAEERVTTVKTPSETDKVPATVARDETYG